MDLTTVSPKYQVLIPKRVREQFGLAPGQQLQAIDLLDSRVPVVSIAVPGTVFDKVLSNAQEAKARDAQLIGVAPECAEAELFDMLLQVPTVDELLSPLLTVIPMQPLSYHIAAHRGL
jgi:glucosamine--fructose-6-phosphate aminotransferase (isomerizing)